MAGAEKNHAVIVGAGLTGLVTGYHVASTGIPVTVFEGAEDFSAAAGLIPFGGTMVEPEFAGPHRLVWIPHLLHGLLLGSRHGDDPGQNHRGCFDPRIRRGLFDHLRRRSGMALSVMPPSGRVPGHSMA